VKGDPVNLIDPWGLHGPYYIPPGGQHCISTGTCHYMGNNHVDQGDTPGLLPIIEDYLTERAMNQLAEGNNVAAFIDVSGASAACLAQCMIKPGARHWLIEEGSPYIGKGGAMTLYHYTDKRFRAWGKSSKVLVPRLGSKIISGVSGVSWVILSYETYKCIKECQKSLCKDRKK